MPPKTITVHRTWLTEKSTISQFTTHDGSVTGFMLEPPGPSTAIAGQNRRIPAGTYNLTPHSGTTYKNVFKLYNNVVPSSRAILIHSGSFPENTLGCLMPGSYRDINKITGSRPKLKQLNIYISKYIDTDGVQVVIKEFDPGTVYQH